MIGFGVDVEVGVADGVGDGTGEAVDVGVRCIVTVCCDVTVTVGVGFEGELVGLAVDVAVGECAAVEISVGVGVVVWVDVGNGGSLNERVAGAGSLVGEELGILRVVTIVEFAPTMLAVGADAGIGVGARWTSMSVQLAIKTANQNEHPAKTTPRAASGFTPASSRRTCNPLLPPFSATWTAI